MTQALYRHQGRSRLPLPLTQFVGTLGQADHGRQATLASKQIEEVPGHPLNVKELIRGMRECVAEVPHELVTGKEIGIGIGIGKGTEIETANVTETRLGIGAVVVTRQIAETGNGDLAHHDVLIVGLMPEADEREVDLGHRARGLALAPAETIGATQVKPGPNTITTSVVDRGGEKGLVPVRETTDESGVDRVPVLTDENGVVTDEIARGLAPDPKDAIEAVREPEGTQAAPGTFASQEITTTPEKETETVRLRAGEVEIGPAMATRTGPGLPLGPTPRRSDRHPAETRKKWRNGSAKRSRSEKRKPKLTWRLKRTPEPKVSRSPEWTTSLTVVRGPPICADARVRRMLTDICLEAETESEMSDAEVGLVAATGAVIGTETVTETVIGMSTENETVIIGIETVRTTVVIGIEIGTVIEIAATETETGTGKGIDETEIETAREIVQGTDPEIEGIDETGASLHDVSDVILVGLDVAAGVVEPRGFQRGARTWRTIGVGWVVEQV